MWLIYGYFPENLKPSAIVDYKAGITDFAIQKSIYHKAENCNDDPKYNQYQCLLKEYSKGIEELQINCVSPWGYSAVGGNSKYKRDSCNESDLKAEWEFGYNFFTNATENRLEACKGKASFFQLFAN